MRRNGLILSSALVVGAALVWHGHTGVTAKHATLSAVRVHIPDGHGFSRILDELERAGVRFNRTYVQIYARLKGVSRNLQAGAYDIPAYATAADILDKLLRGDVVAYDFAVIEGWSLNRIIAAMKEHPHIRMESEDPDEIAERLGADGSLEGWVQPKTYRFKPGTSNIELLRLGYERMRRLLDELWNGRPLDFPLKTPYEALILASMVEKEARKEEERPRIAGVFFARLKRGMRLQSDPTVIFGLGDEYKDRLRRKDLQRDTPYNTYTRKGLPPTPIASPGESALRAVFEPVSDGALYFVAKGDGSHYFSNTYDEHRKAVKKYRKDAE